MNASAVAAAAAAAASPAAACPHLAAATAAVPPAEVLGILPDGWNADWLKGAYPPTAFISMPRDAKTAARIAANVALLASFGVPSSVLEVHPQPLADDFLSKRSELISPEVSAQVGAGGWAA